MDKIISYFNSVPDAHRIILLAFSLGLFWIIENIAPITKIGNKWRHASVNSLFMLTAAPVQMLFGYILVETMNWTNANEWGLIRYIPFTGHPFSLFLITFVLLDLGEYIYHVIMHKVKRLWMFHVVHHSDRVVDVSTTLREHPGETFTRLSFLTLWVFLSGACFWALLFRQFIQIASNVFAHAHFRLPEMADRILGLVFVTPNIHHVHHHNKQPYTDKNYGDILSIWDRMFGTFARMEARDVIFGVDTYMDEHETANFNSLTKIPFGKYRSNKDNA